MDFDDGRYKTPSQFQLKEIQVTEEGLSVSLEPRPQSRTRGPVDSIEKRMGGQPAKLLIHFGEFDKMAAALTKELYVLRRVVRENNLWDAVDETRRKPWYG